MLPSVFPVGTQVQQMVTSSQARAEAYGKLSPGSPAHLAKAHMEISDGLCLELVQESDQNEQVLALRTLGLTPFNPRKKKWTEHPGVTSQRG